MAFGTQMAWKCLKIAKAIVRMVKGALCVPVCPAPCHYIHTYTHINYNGKFLLHVLHG